MSPSSGRPRGDNCRAGVQWGPIVAINASRVNGPGRRDLWMVHTTCLRPNDSRQTPGLQPRHTPPIKIRWCLLDAHLPPIKPLPPRRPRPHLHHPVPLSHQLPNLTLPPRRAAAGLLPSPLIGAFITIIVLFMIQMRHRFFFVGRDRYFTPNVGLFPASISLSSADTRLTQLIKGVSKKSDWKWENRRGGWRAVIGGVQRRGSRNKGEAC